MNLYLNNEKLHPIKTKLGLCGLFTVNSVGRSGGLALLSKENIEVTVAEFSKNHIDATVVIADVAPPWRFTGFYGHP